MNSQLSYTTVEPHREDLLAHAASARSFGESRYAPWVRATSLSVRMPRLPLRAAWRRAALGFSTMATVAVIALVVTLSSSIAASRTPSTGHSGAANTSKAPLGLVRDPHSHLWTCIRVKPAHPVAR